MKQAFDKLSSKIQKEDELFQLIAKIIRQMCEVGQPMILECEMDRFKENLAEPIKTKLRRALVEAGFSDDNSVILTNKFFSLLFSK